MCEREQERGRSRERARGRESKRSEGGREREDHWVYLNNFYHNTGSVYKHRFTMRGEGRVKGGRKIFYWAMQGS